MKKTNKIIALILAMVLAFSSVPLMASAAAIKDEVKTVDDLIKGDNLGNVVEWLLKNLNNRKEELVGTALKFVFMFVEDESLQAKIGKTDIMTATDEQLAKILIDWLNANLPTWTAELTDQDWWEPVMTGIKVATFGRVSIDLKNVDGVIKSLYSLANTNIFGDISDLNENALKNVTVKSKGNLGVIYALFQFLADNTNIFKKALIGKLTLGSLGDIKIDGEKLNDTINNTVTDMISPAAIKEMICDAIELDYEAYKAYTADEIVAVAFLKLLTGKDTVTKDEASALMKLSIYDFLEEYAAKIYANLLVEPLNDDVKELLVEYVKPLDDEYGNILDKVFNWNYEFTKTTFDAVLGKGKGNVVAQLNNAVITLLEVILTKDAFKELNLTKGGNENLQANLTKAFRYILPLIKDLDLGVDLSKFTKDAVAKMDVEEMAVAVLKLFFENWFANSNKAELNKATTLEQLAVLAAKYAVTNNEWVPMTISAVSKIGDVTKLTDEACVDLLFEIGMETAAKALDHNKTTTYYTLPATAKWTGADYLDDIVDWALNFVDGLPAAADKLSTERGKLDGEGGFYKLNVVLDCLFDFSFFKGCGNDLFDFDAETMLMDKLIANLLNFDIDSAVKMLAENETSSLFNKPINQAAIDLIDDLLTGLFDEGYNPPATYVLGDIDGKDGVTAADARLALRASVKLETLTETQTKAANVDHKDGVTAADARLILRASVKLDTLS